MSVIPNKWFEKVKKKRAEDTAPAFDSNHEDTWDPVKARKKQERSTSHLRATMHKTLRGVRK